MSDTRLRFTVLGVPVTQGSMKAIVSRTSKKVIVKPPARLRPWRQMVSWEARNAHGTAPLLDGPISLTARFFLVKPRSAPKSRQFPAVKPDLDKLVRAIGDALEGVVMKNDSQIIAIFASKHYGEPARAEIELVAQGAPHDQGGEDASSNTE